MTTFSELPPDLRALLEREKLEALAEFAAGAGHEMNNPLAVIAGRAQLLLKEETDAQKRRELAVIHAQAMRVHEMIADLMLFARPPQPRRSEVNLAELCRRVLSEVSAAAGERNICLQAELSDDISLQADAAQLSVALRALLDNSLEAVGSSGTISLKTGKRSDPPQVEIVVCDDGPGIPPDVRPHIFDPYYSGRPAGRGLGLGLCKCWRIITNHGGSIEVDSQPGQGARFCIALPL